MITSDNLVVNIDTVIYFQPTDPKAAVYEIANYIQGIEQLTVTTLRNVIGSLDLEQTLTSRDQINGQLRGVLDEATGRWGIRVNRVELKAIDPPHSVQDSMEKQMRAERDRRAAILTAEGVKQSQILTAEGDKQSSILRADGQAQAAILKAQGEARAIQQVFDAIHRGNPDSKLLAYQYLQMLPQIANGPSNKVWIVPTELTQALQRDRQRARRHATTTRAPGCPGLRERPARRRRRGRAGGPGGRAAPGPRGGRRGRGRGPRSAPPRQSVARRAGRDGHPRAEVRSGRRLRTRAVRQGRAASDRGAGGQAPGRRTTGRGCRRTAPGGRPPGPSPAPPAHR